VFLSQPRTEMRCQKTIRFPTARPLPKSFPRKYTQELENMGKKKTKLFLKCRSHGPVETGKIAIFGLFFLAFLFGKFPLSSLIRRRIHYIYGATVRKQPDKSRINQLSLSRTNKPGSSKHRTLISLHGKGTREANAILVAAGADFGVRRQPPRQRTMPNSLDALNEPAGGAGCGPHRQPRRGPPHLVARPWD